MRTDRPHLRVITGRVDGEPRGVTLESSIAQFENILGYISIHRLNIHDPARGMRDILNEVFYWSSILFGIDFDSDSLEQVGSDSLTIDFARGEVLLRLKAGETMRSALSAESVRPLLEAVLDYYEPLGYIEPREMPRRACVRLIVGRAGGLGSGLDVLYPIQGPQAVNNILERLLRWQTVTLESAIAELWFATDAPPTMVPFQSERLDDIYAPITPSRWDSDCPHLTIDLAEGCLRLSEVDGALIMVTDLEEEALARVQKAFDGRIRPHEMQMSDILGLHPDYIPSPVTDPF